MVDPCLGHPSHPPGKGYLRTEELVAISTSCGPPRSQGSLQGQRGHRERIWRSECCPPPLAASKTKPLSSPQLHSLPWSPRRCRDGGVAGSHQRPGRGLQKSSCQQCGSQSGVSWKAWAGGPSSTQHLGSAASAVTPATHSHNPSWLRTATCQSNGLDLTLPPSITTLCPVNSIPPYLSSPSPTLPIPGMTPPPSHLCPWARMSRTECKGDLVTAQLAILPIQGKPPLCQFSLSGLKYDLWY